jgi:hypothetical protein
MTAFFLLGGIRGLLDDAIQYRGYSAPEKTSRPAAHS